MLLLTRRRTVVVTPHEVRSYARDSVRETWISFCMAVWHFDW